MEDERLQRPIIFHYELKPSDAERLDLPRQFLRIGVVDGVFRMVKLKGHSGECLAGLYREGDDMFIGWGWEEFRNANSIELDADAIIVRYVGDGVFQISVFDKYGLEKHGVAHNSIQDYCRQSCTSKVRVYETLQTRRIIVEDKEEEPDNIPGRRRSRKTSNPKRFLPPPLPSHQNNSPGQREKLTKRPWSQLPEQDMEVNAETESDGKSEFVEKSEYAEKSEFDEKIEFAAYKSYSVQPSGPFHKCYLTSSSLETLILPADSVPLDYSSNSKARIVLRTIEGREWSTNVIFSQLGHVFVEGWQKFVEDNKLRHGDVCTFELDKENSICVHIFRIQD